MNAVEMYMLDLYTLPLSLAFLDPLSYLFFIPPFLLVQPSGTLSFVTVLDKSESSHVVADSLTLNLESRAEVLAKGNEWGAHDSVGDNLVMMCSEKEEEDSRRQSDVARLIVSLRTVT